MSPPSAVPPSPLVGPLLDLDRPLPPDVSGLVTEDDTPVDNVYSEKQQRLLTDPLYSSWAPLNEQGEPRLFLATANVGLFATAKEPAIVPDVMLALDVEIPEEFHKKEHRSYFIWEYGKTPDVIVEIVSNREGQELGQKLRRYAWMKVFYYVVWDPMGYLGAPALKAFRLEGLKYEPMAEAWFGTVGLGLKPWKGSFEGTTDEWLRWCDAGGNPIATGAERADAEHARADAEQARADAEHARAEAERERAEAERERAEAERERAEAERERAERLAARLRAMGIDPEQP